MNAWLVSEQSMNSRFHRCAKCRPCLNLKIIWSSLLTRCSGSKSELKMNINVKFEVRFRDFDRRVPMSPHCGIIAAAGFEGFYINTIFLSCVRSGQERSAIHKLKFDVYHEARQSR